MLLYKTELSKLINTRSPSEGGSHLGRGTSGRRAGRRAFRPAGPPHPRGFLIDLSSAPNQ
ncbi:hypothetical protein SK128_024214, partial [Halocaridina rubra]